MHRRHHADGEVQLCALLSVKTGGCPEDCAYCPQIGALRQADRLGRERCSTSTTCSPRRSSRARRRRDALLHGRGLARGEGRPGVRPRARHGARRARARHGGLRHARHADARRRPTGSPTRASPPTTTTSTPRPSSTARSSPRAPTTTGSTRSRACATAGITVCCGGIIGMGESIERPRAAARNARQRSIRSPRACRSMRSCRVAGHAARRPAAGRSARARAHDRDRAHRSCPRRRCGSRRTARS